MAYIFNFIETTISGSDFNFGVVPNDQNIDFDFTEADYSASSNFLFSTILVYNILKGSSNNFTSVWVLNSKMYVSTNDTLTVVDLSDNSVYDYYTQTHIGRANESLEHDNVVDINAI